MTGLERFMDGEGRLSTWPSKQPLKAAAVSYIGTKFEFGRFYTEKEVNVIISEWHTFGDYFLLRRALVESRNILRISNGSRYWKGDILNSNTQLDNFTLRNITKDDRASIVDIQKSCTDHSAYMGREFCDTDADELIFNTALPPDGSAEFSHSKLIEDKVGEAVGYMQYYLGYPNGRTAYIGSLFVKNTAQRRGVGMAVANGFAEIAKAAGITAFNVAVMTENEPGFAFWTKQGFGKTGVMHTFDDTGKTAAEMRWSL